MCEPSDSAGSSSESLILEYALECMGGEKFAKWTAVTVEELEAYMGFMILMGIVNLPALRDYWQKDEIFHYSPIARRISRDRFMELTRYLHFADNSSLAPPGTPGYDQQCTYPRKEVPGKQVDIERRTCPTWEGIDWRLLQSETPWSPITPSTFSMVSW